MALRADRLSGIAELAAEPPRSVAAALRRLEREVRAEQRQVPGAAAELLAPRRAARRRRWLLHGPRGTLLGCASLTLRDAPSLAQLGKLEIQVRASARRSGVGTALLGALAHGAFEEGVSLLYGWALPGS